MTLKVYSNPSLADFMLVCHNLPEDEIEQAEAFTGRPFNPEEAASAYYLRPCPKWVITAPDGPIVIAGFDMMRPGVWQDWLFSTPVAWTTHWRSVTKLCRRAMDGMLLSDAHRLQCISLASRIHAHRWYRPLGLQLEGTLHGYGANGEDALMFARLRSPDGQ